MNLNLFLMFQFCVVHITRCGDFDLMSIFVMLYRKCVSDARGEWGSEYSKFVHGESFKLCSSFIDKTKVQKLNAKIKTLQKS